MFRRERQAETSRDGDGHSSGRASAVGRTSTVGRSRRRLGAAAGGALVVAVGISGWATTMWNADPSVQLAHAAAPEPSVITAEVERDQLRSTLVIRATWGLEGTEDVSVAASRSSSDMVATSLPQTGRSIADGDVLMTVNGTPVVALTGTLPMYRDLSLGLVGPDVDQLRSALHRLGTLISVPTAGSPVTADDLTAFERLVARAGFALEPPDPDAAVGVLSAQLAVDDADDAVAAATAALARATTPTGSSALAGQRYTETLAELDAQAREVLTTADSDARRGAISRAALDDRQHGLEDRRAGAVGTPDAEAIDEELRSIQRQRDLLTLDDADRTRETTAALDTIARQRAAAGFDVESSLSDGTDEHAELLRQLTGAQRSAAAAREALDAATRHASRIIPAFSVIYLDQLPRAVTGSNLKLGRAIEGPVVTVAGERPVITADLTPSQVGLVKAGDSASFTSDVDGRQVAATVEQVRPRDDRRAAAVAPQSGDPAGASVTVEGPSTVAGTQMEVVLVPDPTAPDRSTGGGVAGAVRIQSPATPGDELIVPSSAIRLLADGRRTVDVVVDDETATRTVDVSVIAEIDGRSAFRVDERTGVNTLDVGDEVEVRSGGDTNGH